MSLDLKRNSVDALDNNHLPLDLRNFFVIVFSVTYTDWEPNYF